jgi:hypothetical protein
LNSLIQNLEIVRFRRKIQKALALQKRGEARRDGLQLREASVQLEVTWWARDIHPWDRVESSQERSARFVQQALHDTDAAIDRLFHELPQLDVISVRVLDRGSEKTIMAGAVRRSSTVKDNPSVKMRLLEWGLKFRLTGSHFEPLEES